MFEHVILSVQGMTCTGCEAKLFKSLLSIQSITKLQISLALSRAEFDIDTTVISLNDAVAQLERITGLDSRLSRLKGKRKHLWVGRQMGPA